jgi:tetratricopeptide (TPR) repeat protein
MPPTYTWDERGGIRLRRSVTFMRDVPEDLVRRVDDAVRAGGVGADPTADELAAQAALAIELADRFSGQAEDFEAFATAADYAFDEWLLNLPATLASAGMIEQALRVADALSTADQRHAVDYACEATRILARAGRADEARERVAANVSRFGDIPYTWMAAGEALAALGDLDGAADAYDRAVDLAEDRDEPTEVADAHEHLGYFLEAHPEAKSRMPEPRTRVRVSRGTEGQVTVRTTVTLGGFLKKVPRNAPCPCGSGRKYKRCCGSPR